MSTSKGASPLHRRLSESRFEPLTREDEIRLGAELTEARETGNERRRRKVRDELIERHLRLVSSIAGQFTRLPEEEAFAVGCVALTEAMDRWLPGPTSMSAYQWARRYITTSLNKATDASRQIRIPEQVAYKAAINTKAIRTAEATLGRSLTGEEVRDLIGDGPLLADLPSADILLSSPVAANATGEETFTVGDVIPSNEPSPEEVAELTDLVDRVRAALTTLDPEERRVIEARFGLNGTDRRTLAELGDEFDASGEAMRRVEASALAKLQHPANPLSIGDL